MEIIHKDITGSTNDDIMALGKQGYPHLTTVVADYQERGRGRWGRSWSAAPGSHLLFSVLLRPDTSPERWHRIPQIAGMEMIHTVEAHFGPCPEIQLKWPNDLYHSTRKWSGILVESNLGQNPFAVLGIGVNCRDSSNSFPPELRDRVTTLETIFGERDFSPQELLRNFLERLSISLVQFIEDFGPVVSFANRRDYLLGKRISVNLESSQVRGTASGIGGGGELLVRNGVGEIQAIVAGTITEIEP